MNVKKTITIIFLLFVVAAIGTMVLKGFGTDNAEESALTNSRFSKDQSQTEKQVKATQANPSNELLQLDADIDVVYYFMTMARCPSCRKIESYTKETVQSNFSDDLTDGRMIWRMVQVDLPENRHFIEDYQLYTKSVVLVKIRDGKKVAWKNLDQVWNLLRDKTAFQNYIVKEVESFIKES